MDSQHRSRRRFLQNTALLSASLPLAAFDTLGFTGRQNEKGRTSGFDFEGQEEYSIALKDNEALLRAGLLFRKIDLSGNAIQTTQLRVGETELLAGIAGDLRLRFYAASPNRKPPGLLLTKEQKTVWADPENALATEQPVEWKNLAGIDGRNIASFFRLVNKKVSPPQKGITRLHLAWRATAQTALKDVTLHIWYEIHEGYPAIRKWIEVSNNSAQWLKIDRFVIDDITLSAGFTTVTPLTPEERGAESSILAFSNDSRSAGLIAASEIPSALRKIHRGGAMGYADDLFEWVLGPSESFVSEPVFYFAFGGNSVITVSATSTSLDRAVETPFKDFLREAIGMRGQASSVPAPVWCSYSNFLTDLTDANMREQAGIAERTGFATFQLDEGWAATPGPGGSEPGPTFPRFESTCEYIRSKGMQLGLWISCFRGPEAKDLAAIPGGRCLPLFTNTKRGYGMSFSSAWRAYFANDLAYMRDKYGMTYVKMDLTNISKGDIAEDHESRTKKESLLRGLRGLLQASKRTAELAPDVWTQITHEIYWKTPGPPADIAALKHACAFHTSPNTYLGAGNGSKRVSADWNIDPAKMKEQLLQSCFEARQRFFNHRGLPLYSVEFYAAHAVNIKGSLTPQLQDRQVCSWLMGAPTVFAGDLSSLTQENVQHYRRRFDLLKRLQQQYNPYQYFQYSGVPEPTDTDWHWWGKLNPEGAGAVVVIRGNGGGEERTVNIPWVHAGKKYRLMALFACKALGTFTGSRLQKGAVKLSLPVYGQEIIEVAVIKPGAANPS